MSYWSFSLLYILMFSGVLFVFLLTTSWKLIPVLMIMVIVPIGLIYRDLNDV